MNFVDEGDDMKAMMITMLAASLILASCGKSQIATSGDAGSELSAVELPSNFKNMIGGETWTKLYLHYDAGSNFYTDEFTPSETIKLPKGIWYRVSIAVDTANGKFFQSCEKAMDVDATGPRVAIKLTMCAYQSKAEAQARTASSGQGPEGHADVEVEVSVEQLDTSSVEAEYVNQDGVLVVTTRGLPASYWDRGAIRLSFADSQAVSLGECEGAKEIARDAGLVTIECVYFGPKPQMNFMAEVVDARRSGSVTIYAQTVRTQGGQDMRQASTY